MAKAKPYIPQEGDIVSCDQTRGCTSTAVITEVDEQGCPNFSVCLNFRGYECEADRIWDNDRFFDNEVRPATQDEIGKLLAELVDKKYKFRCEDGKIYVDARWNIDEETSPEPKTTTRNDRFASYIYETAKVFRDTRTFKFTTRIARKYCISSAKADLLFGVGLHWLRDVEWLRTTEGRRFCDEFYDYVLGRTEHLAVIPQSQLFTERH